MQSQGKNKTKCQLFDAKNIFSNKSRTYAGKVTKKSTTIGSSQLYLWLGQ